MQSPNEFLNVTLGGDRVIVPWDRLRAYYQMLAETSDRVRCVDMGKTTLGRPFLQVIISSPENLKNLETYRQISMQTADPRGLTDQEMEKLCQDGRAVCVQSMSMHADEIGGAQMAPLLAYDLAAGNSPEILEILSNVIFIMIPCANPDGLDIIVDWYQKTLGTAHEGCLYPKLWHHYGGSWNVYDAIAENLIESRYLNQTLLREWTPQAYQDHHHQPRYTGRFFIVPYQNPVRPYCSPLIWRELAFYGANMAYRLEEAGVKGVSCDETYPGRAHFGFHCMVNSHNIAGMLSESASARLATPLYVHPEQLEDVPESTKCPNPWKGGEWHLADIVRQQYVAAMGLLSTMAKHRPMILRNMMQKALRQTKAGADNPVGAWIIPPAQNDRSSAEKLVSILQRQRIDLYSALEPIQTAKGQFPAGSVVVPLGQPKYGVIMTLLARSFYPRDQFTTLPDGSIHVYDVATDNIAEYMGVEVVGAGCGITGKLGAFSGFPRVSDAEHTMNAAENESFWKANGCLAAGQPVYRCKDGHFYTGVPPEDAVRIVAAKLGVYQLRVGAEGRIPNFDEGLTRLLLEQYGFPFSTVEPGDIRKGALDGLDVLLFPSNDTATLRGTNVPPEFCLPEYRDFLTPEDEERLRAFVSRGGRVLALNKAVPYAIEIFRLNIRDRAAGLSAAQYSTRGSTLRAEIASTPYTIGMPRRALVFHVDAPAMEVTEQVRPKEYTVNARFADSHVLESGLLIGENLLAGRPCMITVRQGSGEVVLYGFSPQFRAQTDGTYKLLFNTLYKSL